MSRAVIGFGLLTVVCATLFAQGTSDSSSGNYLRGRYVFIHAETNYKLIGKFNSVEKLGDRSFAVLDVLEKRQKRTSYVHPH